MALMLVGVMSLRCDDGARCCNKRYDQGYRLQATGYRLQAMAWSLWIFSGRPTSPKLFCANSVSSFEDLVCALSPLLALSSTLFVDICRNTNSISNFKVKYDVYRKKYEPIVLVEYNK